jgi:tetratricopeptide (TPR) repeat protein
MNQVFATIPGLHLPPSDPLPGQAQVAMGKILVQQGAYSRAIPLLEPLSMRIPANSDDAAIVSDALQFLSVAKQYTGDADAAEALNRRALEMERKVYGDEHPRIAEALSNIATAEAAHGRFGEAEKLYDQAVLILAAYYGPNNPEVVQVKSFAGVMALRSGNYQKAEADLHDVLPLQEQEYGSAPNPNIAFTHASLGQLAVAKGNLPAAEKEYEIAVKMNTALYGVSDLKTAMCMSSLAGVLVKEHQYQRAEEQARPATQALVKASQPGSINSGLAQLNLGEALLGQKRYQEAIEPLSAAYEILKTAPPSLAYKLQDDRRDLVQAYIAMNLPEKAAQYRLQSDQSH